MSDKTIESKYFNPGKDYIMLEIKDNDNVKHFFLPSITLNGDCYIRADFREDGTFPEISTWVNSIKASPRIRFRMKKGKFQSGVCVIVNDIEHIYLSEIQKEFSRVHEFESEYLTTPAYYAKVFTTKVNFTHKHKKYGLLPAPKTMSQFVEVLNWLNPKLAEFENVYWRGMADITWSFEAGAARKIREGSNGGNQGDSNIFITDRERKLLHDARQQGHGFRDGRQLSDLELLSVLQHHGAATRLLDFTTNAWIAFWFATEKYFNKDGVLIMALVHDPNIILSHEDSQKPIGEILPDLSSPSSEDFWHSGLGIPPVFMSV